MARKKKIYLICNPEAAFMFGSYIMGWYCGDDCGNPYFSKDFTLYSGVKVYHTMKDAMNDLNHIIDRYPNSYIVEDVVNKSEDVSNGTV